ncbi:molybdenum cofactor biosynthesis protein A [Oceanococcus atlanticus]|uniref:GTP 3',8-cyclase n=1 Tax=Oceanococcus atlanticus TaxID=1317117 RepID=A0A1Y1SGF4_9GAMM|nr:GTP 3',8-cyclase MoaA [Oceanococcus atlanticus]ORE88401.1 molybdenum cofactor biosynthesis protein A [Oceanococcus atlanticus]
MLTDSFGRGHRKLRISITDRCNFRCPYCMPEKPRWMPAKALMSGDDIVAMARVFVTELGITNLRITGGEPLLRRDVVDIIAGLNTLRGEGLKRLSMTSNAAQLARHASALSQAGLQDINISLDSLNPDQFQRLSRGRYGPADVIAGIEAARSAGLGVKLNGVIIRGYNDDQILPLLNFAETHAVELRFIEFMPLDDEALWSRDRVVSAADILNTVGQFHAVEHLPEDGAPARRYRLASGQQFGIIATVTQPFCARCDRLRITADGRLYTCLFGREGTLLRGLEGPALNRAIHAAVGRKPAGYIAEPGYAERDVRMYHLGG